MGLLSSSCSRIRTSWWSVLKVVLKVTHLLFICWWFSLQETWFHPFSHHLKKAHLCSLCQVWLLSCLCSRQVFLLHPHLVYTLCNEEKKCEQHYIITRMNVRQDKAHKEVDSLPFNTQWKETTTLMQCCVVSENTLCVAKRRVEVLPGDQVNFSSLRGRAGQRKWLWKGRWWWRRGNRLLLTKLSAKEVLFSTEEKTDGDQQLLLLYLPLILQESSWTTLLLFLSYKILLIPCFVLTSQTDSWSFSKGIRALSCQIFLFCHVSYSLVNELFLSLFRLDRDHWSLTLKSCWRCI